jgi:hypothetical protein
VQVGVVTLGGDDVRDVAALDRALGVHERDAGLDRDGAAGRVVAAHGHAGDVRGQRLRRRADDGDDVPDAVAQLGRGLEDAAPVDAGALGTDRDEARACALERQVVLGDRHGVGAGRAAAFGVLALTDDDRVAGCGRVDRSLHRREAGGRAVGLVVVDRECGGVRALC